MNLAKKIASCIMGGMLSVCSVPGFKAMGESAGKLLASSAAEKRFFDTYRGFAFKYSNEEGKTESQSLYENLGDFLLRSEGLLCSILADKDADLHRSLYRAFQASRVDVSALKMACEFLLSEKGRSRWCLCECRTSINCADCGQRLLDEIKKFVDSRDISELRIYCETWLHSGKYMCKRHIFRNCTCSDVLSYDCGDEFFKLLGDLVGLYMDFDRNKRVELHLIGLFGRLDLYSKFSCERCEGCLVNHFFKKWKSQVTSLPAYQDLKRSNPLSFGWDM